MSEMPDNLTIKEAVAALPWKKHGKRQTQWSTQVDGRCLTYWPATNRFRYKNWSGVGDVTAFIECGCDWRKYARRKTVVAPTSRYAFGMFVFKNGPHKGEECRVTHRERDLFTVVREDGSSVVVRKRDLQRPNTYEHHQAVKDLKASGETSRFPPLVYILKCNGLYKIGFTATGPDKRISAIQAHNPFEMHLIAVIRGGRGVEAHLHRKFKKYRAKYEWFSLEGTGYRELMDEVRVLGGKQSGRHFDGVKRLVYG